jgi:hypothetical protein
MRARSHIGLMRQIRCAGAAAGCALCVPQKAYHTEGFFHALCHGYGHGRGIYILATYPKENEQPIPMLYGESAEFRAPLLRPLILSCIKPAPDGSFQAPDSIPKLPMGHCGKALRLARSRARWGSCTTAPLQKSLHHLIASACHDACNRRVQMLDTAFVGSALGCWLKEG